MELREVCEALRRLQRKRTVVMRGRIRLSNYLKAVIRCALGYNSNMSEKERARYTKLADKLITEVIAEAASGKQPTHEYAGVILSMSAGVDAMLAQEEQLEKGTKDKIGMVKLAKMLPVAAFINHPNQKGFSWQGLATLIGETDDLAKFANPQKLYRYMACAPWEFQGETFMGSTWRAGKEGKLPKLEWTKYKYSPRKRSIVFNLGTNLIKAKNSFYGRMYKEARKKYEERHPGKSKMQYHRHGMLVMTKLLLLNLWRAWNRREAIDAKQPA